MSTWLRRILASLVDLLLLLLVSVSGNMLVVVLSPLDSNWDAYITRVFLADFVLLFLYHLLEFRLQGTPGKRLLHLQTIMLNGDRVPLKAFLVRSALRLVGFFTLLGFIWPLFSKRNLTLHDDLASTTVRSTLLKKAL